MPDFSGFLKGIGQTAVNVAPYAAGLVARRNQDEEHKRQTALAEQYRASQERRQRANDALAQLAAVNKMGGTILPKRPGGAIPNSALGMPSDADQAVAHRTEDNRLRSGGAIPNSALGIPDESVPDAYGTPSATTLPDDEGGTYDVLLDPSRTPEALTERRQGMTQAAIDRRQQRQFDATAALHAQGDTDRTPSNFKVNGNPVAGFVDKQGRRYYSGGRAIEAGAKVAPWEPTPQASFSFPTITAPDGSQVVARANNKSGEVTPTGVAAKSGAGSTKLTEPQEKSYLFYKLMENSQPQIDAAMRSGKVRKAFVSTYVNSPELLAPLANSQLNAEEQSLVRSFRDFAAGVLRKESGAAVTPSELREVWARYGPGFGDNPRLDTEKSQARMQYMQTMKQQATPAIRSYDNTSAPAPSHAPPAASGLRQKYDAAVHHLQQQQKSPAEIAQILGPPPGDGGDGNDSSEPDMSGGRSLP